MRGAVCPPQSFASRILAYYSEICVFGGKLRKVRESAGTCRKAQESVGIFKIAEESIKNLMFAESDVYALTEYAPLADCGKVRWRNCDNTNYE